MWRNVHGENNGHIPSMLWSNILWFLFEARLHQTIGSLGPTSSSQISPKALALKISLLTPFVNKVKVKGERGSPHLKPLETNMEAHGKPLMRIE